MTRDRRFAGKDAGNPGRELALEIRQELVPDPVARNPKIRVGGVFPECEAAGRDIRAQLGARDVEERPDDPSRTRQDAGEAARTGAAQQAQQERFGLVVAAVSDRDPVGREPIGAPVRESA